MTIKLYIDDPYLHHCTAKTIRQTQVHAKPGIILDRTIFYPTSGGQPHDTGTLNRVAVTDVIEDPNHQIIHVLEKPLEDSQVECEINWERRFDHMQQHTGQHILSQALLKTVGAETLSFHLGEQGSTIDINQAGLALDAVTGVEKRANSIIFENRDIIGHLVGKSEIHQFPIRKPPTVEDCIRIVEIKNFDYSPCGGTHCSRTGEIGILKIRRHENYKGGTRFHFVCGFRALKDYQAKTEILKQLTTAMSAAEPDLLQNILRLKDDLKARRKERDDLKWKLLDYEADSLYAKGTQQAGIHLIKTIFDDRHPKEINLLAKKIVSMYPDAVTLFGIKSKANAQLIFHCSPKLAFDMGQLMKTASSTIKGLGGGRREQAQGGGPLVERLEDALQGAENELFNGNVTKNPEI
jgi:alanyl-tRNA synthetase